MAIGDGKNAVISVPASGAATVQPPSGEEWLVKDIATSTAFSGGLPSGVQMGLYDGTNTSWVRPAGFLWQRRLMLFVNNALYLRFADTDGVADTLSYSAVVTAVSGITAGRGDAKIAIGSVAASAYMTVQPPAGETWSMAEVGSSQLHAFSDGLAPEVETTLYDGTNTMFVQQVDHTSYLRPWVAMLTNTIYARIQNKNAATALLSYSAVRMS